MQLPKDLVSKSRQILKRPQQPSLNEILAGDTTPPMSDAQKAGLAVAGTIASREARTAESLHFARLEAKESAEDARDKAILARYEQRLKEVIG